MRLSQIKVLGQSESNFYELKNSFERRKVFNILNYSRTKWNLINYRNHENGTIDNHPFVTVSLVVPGVICKIQELIVKLVVGVVIKSKETLDSDLENSH